MNQWLTDVVVKALAARLIPALVGAGLGFLVAAGWLPAGVAECVDGAVAPSAL